MNDELVPIAVVGAGNMGANHIRVYDQLPGAELVEVVETDPERAREVREQYDVAVVDDVADLERAQAATIAVPNRFHREVSVACIEAGLDVLVEKPLAMNVDDAQAIVDAAAEAGAVLQVGHIERFNPAVETLGEILADEEVIALEAHRLGPFNEQLSGESVVFDLMIHDVDVIESLIDSEVSYVDAIGTRSRSSELDHAIAHLRFEDGTTGTMTASHVTHGKVRDLTVTARDAFIELDYQGQNVTINRRGVEETTSMHGRTGYRTETISETPFVQTEEPLKKQLEHFVSNVRDRASPRVDGEDGLSAVRRAAEIVTDTEE